MWDVFVHDRVTGQTSRVSVSSSGEQGNGESRFPSLSADGRYVAFESLASNLVPSDTNGTPDVFIHDRVTGQMTRVSVSSSGEEGNGNSSEASVSANGRYVAFHSSASNLVPGDTNGTWDVFVHDRVTGQTSRVSVSSSGEQGNGNSYEANISPDGRYVAFGSAASNLVPGDTNGTPDVFVHDRVGYPSWIPGDTDRDGDVDLVDLGNLATYYGTTSGATWGQGDFDGDVDLVDLGALAGNYGHGVPAPLNFAADAEKLGLSNAKDATADESSEESKTENLLPVPGGCIPSAIVLMMCLAGAFFWLGSYPGRKS
jgi:Tol biopolymer transport system component